MSMEPPAAIAAYFAGSNAHDADACTTCLTDDAAVRDERRERQGKAAIRGWMAEASEKYRHTVEVIGVAARDGKTAVIGPLAGNSPGSPVDLRYAFALAGEKIARLEIRP